MKIINIIIHLIAGLGYVGGAIWGVIEGLKYFIKDQPVNWMFLAPLIGGIVLAFINMLFIFANVKKGRF